MNWGSILSQAKTAMKSPQRKQEADRCAEKIRIKGGTTSGGDTVLPLSKAGEMFIDILKQKIEQHAGENYSDGQLGKTAIEAASNLSSSAPYKEGHDYCIDINFEGNKHRDSLAPDTFEGVRNIIALLNNGYTAYPQIRGVWKGHESNGDFYFSLTDRAGAHFVQEAIDEFRSLYGDKFGIIDIEAKEYEDS